MNFSSLIDKTFFQILLDNSKDELKIKLYNEIIDTQKIGWFTYSKRRTIKYLKSLERIKNMFIFAMLN